MFRSRRFLFVMEPRIRRDMPRLMVPISFKPDANSPHRSHSRSSSDVTAETSFVPIVAKPKLCVSTLDRKRKPRPKPIHLATLSFEPPKKRKDTFDIEEFEKLDESVVETKNELGMGSGGTVYLVFHRDKNVTMAKKVIHNIHPQRSKELMRELRVLNQCKHENIISFFGANHVNGELNIYMEYMDVGSLEKISKIAGRLHEDVLTKIAVQVIEALVYLYDTHRVIHRDIKPSNILVNSKGQVKICDFGVSGQVENSIANTFVGTGFYMSPERIQAGKYSTQSDTWSLGLTLLELALGYYPFGDPPQDLNEIAVPLAEFELLQRIVHDQPPELDFEYSEIFRSFIRDSLIKDATKRPSPKEILRSHPIVAQETQLNIDMVQWARSFLDPNLSEQQMHRWSLTQEHKRQSLLDKRKSKVRSSQLGKEVSGLRTNLKSLEL